MSNLTYLQGYPEQLLSQVRTLINEQRLGDVLAKRYPGTHDYATDKALWQYTQDLKNQFLRNAPPINKVMYDNKIHVLKNALGLHTAVSRVQGGIALQWKNLGLLLQTTNCRRVDDTPAIALEDPQNLMFGFNALR